MTGEVTLTGKVLPVGGIKEKVMAARRSHVSCLVLPQGNRKDYEELPAHLKEGMEVHFAADYKDVFAVAFTYDDAIVAKVREAVRKSHPAHTAAGDGASGVESGTGGGSGGGGSSTAAAAMRAVRWQPHRGLHTSTSASLAAAVAAASVRTSGQGRGMLVGGGGGSVAVLR